MVGAVIEGGPAAEMVEAHAGMQFGGVIRSYHVRN